ncbi:MAG: GAF domain-containing protein [Chloroflexota bacterium]|nr:GAF domain-containing protein [Chloroflexota bacterium]
MPGESPSYINDQERLQLLRALRESEILRELAELLASSLDLEHILQVLVKRTTQVCEVQRCAIWLLGDDRKVLRPVIYHLTSPRINPNMIQAADRIWHHSTLQIENPFIHRLLTEKGMIFLNDQRAEESMRPSAETFLVRSILYIALVREGRPVGMMSLDNPGETGIFSEEQQQLARAIAQQAAMAIDNAQLYQQAQTQRRRAEQLIERSQAIYEVAMAVNSGEDLPTVLEIATQHLVRGLGAEGSTTLLLDGGMLHPVDSTGLLGEQSESHTAALADLPYCQQAATTGLPLFVAARRLGVAELLWYHKFEIDNAMVIPLMVGARHKEGQEAHRCVGFIFVNYHDPDHSAPKGHYAFAQDIAAQCALAIEKAHLLQRAHQAAVLATERANTLNAIFHAMTDAITVLNQDGQVLMRNSAAAIFMGEPLHSRERLHEVYKRHPASTLHGQQISEEDFALIRALRGERIRGERISLTRADGQERVIEINVAPMFNGTRKQVGIVSAFRDITEQVRIEQHIRQALETMLHMAEAVSGITDIQDILSSVLEMALTALNCQQGVVQLRDEEQDTFIPLLTLSSSAQAEDRQHLSEQKQWLAAEIHQRRDYLAQLHQGHAILINSERYTHLFASTRQDPPPPGKGLLTLVAPITHNNRLFGLIWLDHLLPVEHSETESAPGLPLESFSIWDMAIIEGMAQLAGLAMEQARWQQEALNARTNETAMREANALKDEFLAITAHEFRTPLTLILAHAQVGQRVLRRTPNQDQSTRLTENLSIIEAQTRHLTNIVNTFLEATQINRGQLVLTLEEVDLAAIAQQAVHSHSTSSTMHHISCHIEPCGQPYLVMGDSARLLQVVANLLQNAIKYSPQGEPITLSVQRYTQDGPDGRQAIIEACVADRGIGVPSDAQPRLFERFYRAPNIQISKARGVGLGLYVVAELLHMQGGTIRVESSGVPGEGSRFIFTLPALESQTNGND